jgi:choline dehydrogenase
MNDLDYIVVGAGSAGCVLANRLTEDGKSRVLLLEFGGSDRSVLIQMPAALSIPMNMPKYNWGFATEPEPHLGGRRLATPRGKVLGGSSSINGMVWVRGHPFDFDGWEKQGAEGWGYRYVLPYFRRADAHEGGDPQYRGSDGPLYNRYGRLNNPLHHAWLEAARQAGYPATPDYNGYQQEGFGRMAMSVHRGRRWSTANAYLRPALWRENLRVLTHARDPRAVLRRACRGCGVSPGRRGAGSVRGARGDPGSCQGSGRPRSCARSASRWCRSCQAWARTCRTIWNSISRWSVASRSRSIQR